MTTTANSEPAACTFSDAFPASLDEAVARLSELLSDAEQEKLAAMEEARLENLNSGLGARIRRGFGLWRGNRALQDDCGALNPEEASLAIIRAYWLSLRS